MKSDELLDAIGEIDDELIACGRAKKKHRLQRWLSLAACLVLLACVGVQLFSESGLWRAGCSSFAGTLVDGVYYYAYEHGIYACGPGQEPEKKMSDLFVRDWYVNDYGIYYVRRKSLYVLPHETGKAKRLYTARKCTHILAYDYGEDVIVSIFDRHRDRKREVLIDGRTGAFLGEVQPEISFDQAYKTGVYSDFHVFAGTRKLELVQKTADGYSVCDVLENGRSLLPAGLVSNRYYQSVSQDALMFDLMPEDGIDAASEKETRLFLLVTDGGRTEVLTMPTALYSLGNDGWLYSACSEKSAVLCISLETGEQRTLQTDGQTRVDFYDIETDGEMLYACAPWDTRQESWRIEHDENGGPVKLILQNADITK